MELPRRPHLKGVVASPWYFVPVGTRVCAPRGDARKRGRVVSRRAQVVLGLGVLLASAFAATSAGQSSPRIALRPDATSPLLTKAIAAQTTRAGKWRNAPGIVGSGVAVTSSGRPVIEVFTTRPGVRVPKTLAGVPVRTVVTGMIVARSATLRYPRPVPIGVSTGLADAATGTLGATGHERSERLCALEQPRLRRGKRGKHRRSHPPAWPH